MARVSKQFERDWNFYTANADKFNFCGEAISIQPHDVDGLTAKKCFHALDSTGQSRPCKEPELLRSIVMCKKSVNLHIIMWAEGFENVCIGVPELLREFVEPPEWVGRALVNQVKLMWRKLK